MFNDLGHNGQNQAAVDDIFAETDNAQPSPFPSSPIPPVASNIEAHRVGLNSDEKLSVPAGPGAKKSYLKIIIFTTIGLAVIGGAYFAYSQYMKIQAENEQSAAAAAAAAQTAATTTKKSSTANYVSPSVIPSVAVSTSTIPEEASSSSVSAVIPAASGTESYVVGDQAASSSASSSVSAIKIDSDGDGLTDDEERALGTNPNLVDTDGDGLSDYEEVKIYHSNPLSTDTDGDGYPDGAEVKSGYDPTRAGAKLPGNLKK